MAARQDLQGKRFGKWTAISFVPGGRSKWLCRCDCSTEREVNTSDLKNGKSVSCGCTFGRDKDLTGMRFGDLVVLGLAPGWKGKRGWLCECDCGNETVTLTHYLTHGNTVSCGCRKAGAAAKRCTTHGQARRGQRIPEYQLWANIKERCHNANGPQYAEYGGRGISMWPDWRNSFERFLTDVGQRPSPKHSLDRIDNSKGYEPGNVRWATRTEQNNNRRGNNILTLGDDSRTLAEWSAVLGISPDAILARLARGWSIEKALTTQRIHDRRGLVGPQRPEYTVWCAMRYRCNNPKDPSYHRYGGRGIKVCQEWTDSFDEFLSDMGERPSPLHRLERKDNNGDYTPDNCCWATIKEQANNRRSNVTMTLRGETKTMSAWAEQLGVTCAALRMRKKKGWSDERILTTPFEIRR